MSTIRWCLLRAALVLAGATRTVSAQQTSYDLSALLPTAEEIAPDAVLAQEAPNHAWGGIAGFFRNFESSTGMLAIGSSTTMSVQTAASLFRMPEQARAVVMMLRGVEDRTVAEIFGIGAAQALGASVDSLSAERVDPPEVGEEAAAFAVYLDLGVLTAEMQVIIFQRGNYLGYVSATGPPGAARVDDLVPLATTIDRRMQATPVEDLALLDGSAPVAEEASQPAEVPEPSLDLTAARGLGVDLEILLTRPNEVPAGMELTEERAYRPLDGVATLVRDYEAALPLTDEGSSVLRAIVQLTLHENPAGALRKVAMAEVYMTSCLAEAPPESIGADIIMVSGLEVPVLAVPAIAVRAQLHVGAVKVDVVNLVFASGSLSGNVGIIGWRDRVSADDAVGIARGVLERIGDLVPARRAVQAAGVDSASVAARLDLERTLRRGDIDAALRQARAIDETTALHADTWEAVCRWGGLWNQAESVLEACDRAVSLSDAHPEARDSRGMARALTGDLAGAAEDFQAYADWTADEDSRLARFEWIEQIENGEQPLTEEVLTSLRGTCWLR